MARNTPVKSFGPELLSTLLAGATEIRRIKMPYRSAVRFRQRLYMLRHAMKREGHSKADDVQRVFVRIQWGAAAGFPPPEPRTVSNSKRVERPEDLSTPCIVVVGPQDSDFMGALKDAGIEVKPSDDLLANLENPTNG